MKNANIISCVITDVDVSTIPVILHNCKTYTANKLQTKES